MNIKIAVLIISPNKLGQPSIVARLRFNLAIKVYKNGEDTTAKITLNNIDTFHLSVVSYNCSHFSGVHVVITYG